MFGLIVSDPALDPSLRDSLAKLLHDYDLPLSGWTQAPAPLFCPGMSRASFLRAASAALLQPGQPLPAEGLMRFLGADPLPANVLRRHLFLQLSLMPYLRPGRTVTQLEGGFLLGNDVLAACVSEDDTFDVLLPPGIWTELNGNCRTGRFRGMRGYLDTPLLVRENTLLPVSINGQSLVQTADSDADRLTLHWYQPGGHASCILADGTAYHAALDGDAVHIEATTNRPFHLILHRDGAETLIR